MTKPKPTAKSHSAASAPAKATPPKKAAATKKAATKKSAAKKTSARSTKAASVAAEKAFIEASIARGEAQPAGKDGSLPEGATHELVEAPNGQQTVRRRRFSAA
jgi:hypothetical protein